MTDLPALTFEGLTLTPVDHPGGLWFTAAQVGMALGYGISTFGSPDLGSETEVGGPDLGRETAFGSSNSPKRAGQFDPPFWENQKNSVNPRVRRIYLRHAEEFDDSMTAEMDLPTAGGPQKTRIFSVTGCLLLAVLARTERSRRFRIWLVRAVQRMDEERQGREHQLELFHQNLGFAAGMLWERLQKYPPERQRLVRQVLLRRRLGDTQRAIAEQAGASIHVVRGILRRFGPFCHAPEAELALDRMVAEERRRALRDGRPCLAPEPDPVAVGLWLRLPS